MTDAELARKKRRHRNERIAAALLIVIAIAAVIAIGAWNERAGRELRRDQSYIPQPAVVTAEIRLLQEYVRIDTSTPAGEAAGARWIAAFLARNGVNAELIPSDAGRLNVYARIKGREAGKALLLFNHIDVVPPVGAWTHPPFSAAVFDGAVYGRGSIDMKSIALCQLLAFIDLAKSGEAPKHDLVFLATADEETGSEFGMQWLLAHRQDIFDGIEFALTEGGVTEILRERMTYFGVETGGKQVVKLTLAAPDEQSLQQLRIALEPYMFSRRPERILPVVREYFHAAAPSRLAFRPYLDDIDWAIREGHFWRLPLPYRELATNTIWCRAPSRGETEWEMDLHLRNLPDENPDTRIAWLESLAKPFGVHIKRVWAREGPAPTSPTTTPLFRLIEAEAKRRYGANAGPYLGYRSANDARFLRPRGIVAYGLTPFPVSFAQSITIHGVNENLGVGAFGEGVAFMKNVVADWSQSD
jgi:acetylornithine deacetylase/succinyl-diaminopimelate desuccinylase-like protein